MLPWAAHDPVLRGFLIAICIAVVAATATWMPFGPPDRLQGHVSEVGRGLGRYSTSLRAMVSVGGRPYLIQIDYADSCDAGDQIRLLRVHRLWRKVVMADDYACVWPDPRR